MTGLHTPGIGIVAERLIVTSCKAGGWAMCLFLKLHSNGALDVEFTGRMTPKEVVMIAGTTMGFQLGNGIVFSSGELHSHLIVSQGSDKLYFTATVELTRTNTVENSLFSGKMFWFHFSVFTLHVLHFLKLDLDVAHFLEFNLHMPHFLEFNLCMLLFLN